MRLPHVLEEAVVEKGGIEEDGPGQGLGNGSGRLFRHPGPGLQREDERIKNIPEGRLIPGVDGVHEGPWSYSPDGQKILLMSDRGNAPFTIGLFTMNADGSDVTPVFAGGSCPNDGNCGAGSWGAQAK